MVSCFVIVIIIIIVVVISIMIHVYIVTYVDIIFSMYIFITIYEQGTIFICPFYNCLKKHSFFLFPRKKIKIKIVSIYVSISNSISREGNEWRGSKLIVFNEFGLLFWTLSSIEMVCIYVVFIQKLIIINIFIIYFTTVYYWKNMYERNNIPALPVRELSK